MTEKKKPYKIVLADDHAMFRYGLKLLLEMEDDLEVAGEASSGKELLQVLSMTDCSLVILDLTMHGLHGISAIETVRKKFPNVKIMICSHFKDTGMIHRVLDAGVHGYVYHGDDLEGILPAVRKLQNNEMYISPEIQKILEKIDVNHESDLALKKSLTEREIEILKCLEAGLGTKEIASKLNTGEAQIHIYKSHLLKKVNLENDVELVQFAVTHGII